MKVLITAKEIEVLKQVDVLVVGGGPAGIGAAVSASRGGANVLLLEKRAFLGGNITSAYVETCNWFLNNTLFPIRGLYREIEDGYKTEYGRSHEIRDYAPFRFNGEYLKIFLDELMARENVSVLFHSFVNDVVIEDNRSKAVIIQT
jgi:flavin-dependent dehydrogenase